MNYIIPVCYATFHANMIDRFLFSILFHWFYEKVMLAKKEKYYYFATLFTGFPAIYAFRFSSMMPISRSRAAVVAQAMCGVM